MRCPAEMKYWTADEVAECVDFHDPDHVIYNKLWSFLRDAKNPTPLGGDGSDGTVETPDGRLDERNDDKAPHWWGRLTESEQNSIFEGWKKDYAF